MREPRPTTLNGGKMESGSRKAKLGDLVWISVHEKIAKDDGVCTRIKKISGNTIEGRVTICKATSSVSKNEIVSFREDNIVDIVEEAQ
jgi:hypothetical protein